MKYFFKPTALRDIKKLPKTIQKDIIRKIDFYISTPNPLKFSESLKDNRFGERRFRIGDYRVIFDIKEGNIIILKVGNRKDIYK